MLNILVVVIGWLYWKTLYRFYRVKGMKEPWIYGKGVEYVAVGIVALTVGIVTGSFIDSILKVEGMQELINWLMLASELTSTIFFIVYRVLYHQNIFSSVKLSKRTVKR